MIDGGEGDRASGPFVRSGVANRAVSMLLGALINMNNSELMRSYSGNLNVLRPLPSLITSRRVEWLRWSRDLTVMSSIPVWLRHSSLFVFITMYRQMGHFLILLNRIKLVAGVLPQLTTINMIESHRFGGKSNCESSHKKK